MKGTLQPEQVRVVGKHDGANQPTSIQIGSKRSHSNMNMQR